MMVICDLSGKKELFIDIHTFVSTDYFVRAYNIFFGFFSWGLKERGGREFEHKCNIVNDVN